MALVHAVLAAAPTSVAALYLAATLGGATYGAQNALNPAVVSEIFGLEHFGALYTAMSLAIAAGSFLIANYLASRIYDRVPAAPGGDCVGGDCFRATFAVCSVLCALGALAQVVLARLTRPRYAALARRKARQGTQQLCI